MARIDGVEIGYVMRKDAAARPRDVRHRGRDIRGKGQQRRRAANSANQTIHAL